MRPFNSKKSWGRFIAAGAVTLSLITPASAAELVVSAAASLTNAFTEIGKNFEQQHKDITVLNSFAASDVLLQQIINGAPVDVFASADQTAMDKAVEAKAIDSASRADFVKNSIVLIVPADNPRAIKGLDDLKAEHVTRIAYGSPVTVPIGRYTKDALENSGHWGEVEKRKIIGQNVRQVLDYVARGEVDAGFVFATDARIKQDDVTVIESLETTTPVTYPIALVQREGRSQAAQAYIDYVLSEPGQAILAKYGFSQPN